MALIRYLLQVGDRAAHEALRGVLRSVIEAPRAEELRRTEGQRLVEQGRRKGLAKGRAEDVLRTLAARGVRVDARTRRRILQCTDLATLDRWFDRALSATRLSDLLDDMAH